MLCLQGFNAPGEYSFHEGSGCGGRSDHGELASVAFTTTESSPQSPLPPLQLLTLAANPEGVALAAEKGSPMTTIPLPRKTLGGITCGGRKLGVRLREREGWNERSSDEGGASTGRSRASKAGSHPAGMDGNWGGT